MKKIYFFAMLIAIAITCSNAFSQVRYVLQPEACRGKDARINAIVNVPAAENTNYGNSSYIDAAVWTFGEIGGGTGYVHSFIDFVDLQNIPQGATITSATLSLYGVPSYPGQVDGNSGTNACWIQRVTSPWDENSLTWWSHPNVTEDYQTTLPASTSQWNYNASVNVQALVQQMINQPASQRYGFALKLQTESIYRWIAFASSDHPNAALHPKLELTFTCVPGGSARIGSMEGNVQEYRGDAISPEKIKEFENNQFPVVVSPNPAIDNLTIDYELPVTADAVINLVSPESGQVIKTIKVDGTHGKHSHKLDIGRSVTKGSSVLVQVKQGNSVVVRKIVIVP